MNALSTRDRFPEIVEGAEVFFGALAAATKPVERLTITEHAERYRKVSPESGSPWPGDFRIARVPYLQEPQDCLHPDHPARRVTARWAAQLGKTTAIENWFCFIVDQAPGPMMIVMPTLEEASKLNRIKLQPTIDASPRIAHKVKPVNSRDEAGSTTAYKAFAGGFCQIVNAGSAKALQMVSIKYLAMDEVTGYLADVDGRGSPRDQARARQKMYGDFAKEWQGSTPGIAGECVITDDFESGDQRYRYLPCPHCGGYQPLLFENMRGPDLENEIGVHFRCIGCNGIVLDGHKAEMQPSGVWLARRVRDGEPPVPWFLKPDEVDRYRCDPCEGRCRDWQPSYHLWAAYAPRERFADIWNRWEKAGNNPTKLKVFHQQDLAEPYDPAGVELDADAIVNAARAADIPSGKIPYWAALVVSAADVQGYGIKWAAVAFGPGDRYQVIDKAVFEGSPEQSDEPWIGLADALGRTYPTEGDTDKGIDLSGVDSGFATNRVYAFCASRPNCYALDGREPQGLPWLGTPVKKDIRDHRKRVVGKTLLYPVGNYDVKTAVTGAMANLILGADELGHWPRNTLHFAADLCDDAFVAEMTAERLVDEQEEANLTLNRRSKKYVNPRAGKKWKKITGRANDWFDAICYAFALAWHLKNQKRLNSARWEALLTQVHGMSPERDLFSVAEATPFEKKAPQPSGPPKEKSTKNKWAKRFQ